LPDVLLFSATRTAPTATTASTRQRPGHSQLGAGLPDDGEPVGVGAAPDQPDGAWFGSGAGPWPGVPGNGGKGSAGPAGRWGGGPAGAWGAAGQLAGGCCCAGCWSG
jgi:hypothetical protein